MDAAKEKSAAKKQLNPVLKEAIASQCLFRKQADLKQVPPRTLSKEEVEKKFHLLVRMDLIPCSKISRRSLKYTMFISACGFSVERRIWFSGEVSQAHRHRPLERLLCVEQSACKLLQPFEAFNTNNG